jgi:hypothetical protein
VAVLYGSGSGLSPAGNQLWSQDAPGVLDHSETGDMLGFTVGSANFGNGSQDDLVMGVPFEDLTGAEDAGAANVLYGSPGGLGVAGNQFWTQDSADVVGTADPGDELSFGLVGAGAGRGVPVRP